MATSSTPSHHAGAAHHGPSAGKLVLNWAVLCALTFTTFGVSKIPISAQGHLAAAIFISCVKVTLVVLVFMHLWGAEGPNRLVFVVSFLFLLVLMFFVMADVSTRFTLSNSRIPPLPKIDQKMLDPAMPPGMSGSAEGAPSGGSGPSSGEAGK